MSVYIAAVTNAVVCKCVNDELVTWVMRCVGHNIVLVGRVLMCTTESASLANTPRSSCIFVRVVGTDCILLMPLHTSVSWMSRGRLNIFVQRFGSLSDPNRYMKMFTRPRDIQDTLECNGIRRTPSVPITQTKMLLLLGEFAKDALSEVHINTRPTSIT